MFNEHHLLVSHSVAPCVMRIALDAGRSASIILLRRRWLDASSQEALAQYVTHVDQTNNEAGSQPAPDEFDPRKVFDTFGKGAILLRHKTPD
jgi:hypothetical protein